MNKLLGIFAHPGDESPMAAGTIAKYVRAGWRADLVVATNGEGADRGQFSELDQVSFSELRQKEVQEAGRELGVTSVTFLDFKDGGLSARTPGDIEDHLTRIITEAKPDVVLTYEPSGVDNDPDHVRLSLAATFSFQKYASDRNREQPDDPKPPKLYYACEPEGIVSYLVREGYYPGESFGKPLTGTEDKRITTVIDISRTSSVKLSALSAYESQRDRIIRYASIPNHPFLGQEYFILRYVGINEAFVGKNDRVSDRI